MEKRGLVGLIAIIGIVLAVGFFWFAGKSGNGEECVADEDCVKVQIGCCPCNMGGEEKCVLASEVGEYEAKLENCSENVICAAVFNCEIESCSCVGGECVEK